MQRLLETLSLAIICSAVVCAGGGDTATEGAGAGAGACRAGCVCEETRLACAGAALPPARLARAELAGRASLRDISWTDSHLAALDIDLFAGLLDLQYIDLSGNEIVRTEHGQFARLSRLKYLNMSNNRIDDIPRFTFADLESLEVLDISHNRLRAIPFQVFGPMTNLQHLDISHNQIATFLDFYFHPNRHMKKLFLNNNNLVKVTPNALVNLRELEILDLSSNKLDYLPKFIFDYFDHLRTLNLSHNQFPNISQDTFKKLQSLELLDIGGNKMRALPPTLFQYNERLNTIYLEKTEIQVIQNTNFKGLFNLQRLYIRNNEFLREIEPFVFQDTPSLTHLDISANAMTFLPLSLKMLDKLQELRINKNPWACDCRMAWFASWAEKRIALGIIKTDLSCRLTYPNDMVTILNHTNCKPPELVTSSPLTLYRLRSNALLECKFAGNPPPSLTWITPTRTVFHWNPDSQTPDIYHKHGVAHDQYYRNIDMSKSRLRVQEDGSLFVGDIHREDCGTYICFASNPSANVTATVVLNIDPMTMFEIKMYSLLCGAICAATFLGLTLLVQAFRVIFYRSVCHHLCYL